MLKTVLKNDDVEVVHGDAIEFLDVTVDNDLVFLDPPFNIGQDYGDVSDKRGRHEFEEFICELTFAAMQSLRDGGILVCHGPDELAELWSRQRHENGWVRLSWNIWHFTFAQNIKSNWPNTKCHSIVFRKGDAKHTWNIDENLVETERRKMNDKRVANKNGWKVPGSVWGVASDGPYWGRVQGNSAERCPERPNQLPEVYYARLFRAYTNRGDSIVDPCCGTGGSLVVGKALGRKVFGCDLSEEAVKSTVKRLERGAVRL